MDFKNNEKILYHSNELSRIYHNFSISELKLFYFVLIFINPFNVSNEIKINLSKKLLFEYLEIKRTNPNYQFYKQILNNLSQKSFIKIYSKKQIEMNSFVVFKETFWNDKKKNFNVEINKNFMPHIEKLKNHFTKIKANFIPKFKSKFGLLLYIYIISWNNTKENIRIESEEKLRKIFGIDEKSYFLENNFRSHTFENKVIKTAVNDINKVTDLKLSYEKTEGFYGWKNYKFIWIIKESSKKYKT